MFGVTRSGPRRGRGMMGALKARGVRVLGGFEVEGVDTRRLGSRCECRRDIARVPLLPEDYEAPWAEATLASSDFVGAALLAQGALDDDRFDEPALRTLMIALALGGRPASALAAYATMRSLLAPRHLGRRAPAPTGR